MAQPAQRSKALTERDQIRGVETSLKQMRERLISALPRHITVQQFIATVLTACSEEPKLLSCDRHSLFIACLKCARDGLLPDRSEAAIVPFWDKKRRIELAVYMPMVQGLLKKVRNSGELASFSCNAVYELDVFEYELGDNERIVHKPVFRGKRGILVGAYAIAKTKDGAIYRRVLNEEDVQKIKAFSKAENGPWTGPFESEMWVKSAIRRISKILPKSSDINNYLNNGPPLPATDAESVLPDATGEEGLQSAEYELRTRALLALNESPNEPDTLAGIWTGIKGEYDKLGVEIPLEVEDTFQMKSEALKPENQKQ